MKPSQQNEQPPRGHFAHRSVNKSAANMTMMTQSTYLTSATLSQTSCLNTDTSAKADQTATAVQCNPAGLLPRRTLERTGSASPALTEHPALAKQPASSATVTPLTSGHTSSMAAECQTPCALTPPSCDPVSLMRSISSCPSQTTGWMTSTLYQTPRLSLRANLSLHPSSNGQHPSELSTKQVYRAGGGFTGITTFEALLASRHLPGASARLRSQWWRR